MSRAVTLIVIGLIVVFDPVTMKHLDALLLGSAFIVLGIFMLFFSILCKYPHWKMIFFGGALNLVIGLLFFVQGRDIGALNYFLRYHVSPHYRQAVLTMREDADRPPRVKQFIPYTDFPDGMLKMYLIDRVLLLPSEY